MNKERRKKIARALALIAEAQEVLTICRDEEQEYYDNMPESFQNGDKGTTAEGTVEALNEAVDALEELAQGTLTEI